MQFEFEDKLFRPYISGTKKLTYFPTTSTTTSETTSFIQGRVQKIQKEGAEEITVERKPNLFPYVFTCPI